MKAIILVGGKGIRLKDLTEELPKPLILVNGKPILGYILDSLLAANIRDIILLTGYKEEKIKSYLNQNYSHLNVKFIRDPPDQIGSYIVSLSRIRNIIDEDLLFICGDMLIDYGLVKKIVDDGAENSVLVNINPDNKSKDFKASIEEGIIKDIGVDIKGNLLMPLFKYSKKSFRLWLDEIDKFVKKGNVYCYAEDALASIYKKIRIKPVYFDKELCMEIDNFEDLSLAERSLKECGLRTNLN